MSEIGRRAARKSLSERFLILLCTMRCLVAITFLALAIFLSIIVVGVTSKDAGEAVADMALVVDTDAGTDDAIAIMLFLEAQKRFYDNTTGRGPKVVAITTVHGNTGVTNVTRNVLRILRMENRLDIPVYKGASRSLKSTPASNNYFGYDGLGDVPDLEAPSPVQAQPEHAAVALVRMARQYPGELTIIALGPLTNIALAIRLDEDFLKNLKHLYILGGATEGRGNKSPGVEFNFYMDPEANYVVMKDTEYHNGTISLLSWEQVEKLKITQRWRAETLGAVTSARVQFLNEAERATMQDLSAQWDFADPVLAAVVVRPRLAFLRTELPVVVLTQGEARGGIMVDYYGNMAGAPTVGLISELDVDEYKRLLLDYLAS